MLLRAGMLGGVRFALAYEEGVYYGGGASSGGNGASSRDTSASSRDIGASFGSTGATFGGALGGRRIGHSAEMSAVPIVSRMGNADPQNGSSLLVGRSSNPGEETVQKSGEEMKKDGGSVDVDKQREEGKGSEMRSAEQHDSNDVLRCDGMEEKGCSEVAEKRCSEVAEKGCNEDAEMGQNGSTQKGSDEDIHNDQNINAQSDDHISKDKESQTPVTTPLHSVDLFGVDTDYSPLSITPTPPPDPQQSLITDLVSSPPS